MSQPPLADRDWSKEPLFQGGQGRTAEEVSKTGVFPLPTWLLLLVAIVFITALKASW